MIRGAWQLERLVINYSRTPSSRGVYDLMREKNSLVEFAKANPQIEIVTKLNPNRMPHVIGTYVGKIEHQVGIKNANPEDIMKVLHKLRNRSSRDTSSLKHWGKPITKCPSIQGLWTPEDLLDRKIVVKRRS
mmetsp:Transcript_12627/g.17506  ORF Transcript_12627/g.17506 Transcript_12627/m.17506 type:complete len:132 (-) Transcript_12627:41-436(-)